jgi:hypothetical protein
MLAHMRGVVRRPRAAAAATGLAIGVWLGLGMALSGCAGIGQPAPYDSSGINGLVIPTPSADPADFVTGVDNPWFPLEPGSTVRLDVTVDGADLGWIEMSVLDRTTDIGGLAATGVTTASDIDGAKDISTHYYAQDTAGNVWLVGADEGGVGSWRAGEDGALAGLAVPAEPRLGDGWLTRVVPGLPEATARVEDQSREMVQVLSREGEEADTTRSIYERGVGLVSLEDLDAGWLARRSD